jgi:hypothetical protein
MVLDLWPLGLAGHWRVPEREGRGLCGSGRGRRRQPCRYRDDRGHVGQGCRRYFRICRKGSERLPQRRARLAPRSIYDCPVTAFGRGLQRVVRVGCSGIEARGQVAGHRAQATAAISCTAPALGDPTAGCPFLVVFLRLLIILLCRQCCQSGAVALRHLEEDVMQVDPDAPFRQVQLAGDFCVRQPFAYQQHHFAFTTG